jgi:gliding motility-associated-like protein
LPSMTIGTGPLPPGAQLLWSTGATTSAIEVDTPGTYTLLASGPGLCAASASISVVDVCGWPVYAPNAFTPDGDGINDNWRPHWRANEGATLELTVFDRWGKQVFAATGRDAAWDGQADGTPLPAGVYAWKGRSHDPATGARHSLAGHITLLR